MNKPTEYLNTNPKDDGTYSVTLFDIDLPAIVDKRQRIYQKIVKKPKDSKIIDEIAMVLRLKQSVMKEGELVGAAGDIRKQLSKPIEMIDQFMKTV